MDIIRPLGRWGSYIHRWEVARNLAKLGCEVYAISYTNISSEENLHIYPLPKSKIKYVIQLLKLVMKYHFDIIYTRNIMKGIIGLLIKNLWKSKLVVEVNSISPDEWRFVENYLSTKRKRLKSIKIKFLGYLEIFVIKKADAIIAVTQGIENYLINQGVNKNKIWVIGNGANTDLFRPIKDSNIQKELKNKLHINDDESVVLFVGVLEPWQGVEYLIHAAPLIIEEFPETKFLIVGEGLIRKELENMVSESKLNNKFIFTGTIPYEEVPKYINISDVCISPEANDARNKDTGGSSLKLYEYMACEKPVVVGNIDGNKDVVIDLNAGFVVDPRNSKEMATSIIRLLKDKNFGNQLGKNGRKGVIEKYSWEKVAKRTVEVFEEVLE